MYLKIKDFDNGKPILYGQNQTRTPFGVNLSDRDILPDLKGRKSVPEGSFLAEIDNEIRFLPRGSAATAILPTSPLVELTGSTQSFKVGDTLTQVTGYAKITLDGTIAAGDVFTIAIDAVTYSYTATAASAATLATLIASGGPVSISGDGPIPTYSIPGVKVTAQGTTLILQANDSYALNVSCSSGTARMNVITTDPGYLGACIVPLGTINSIVQDTVSGNRVITLNANAAFAAPVGSRIGLRVDRLLGIAPIAMDFTDEPIRHYAPICEADGVYEKNLPYCDRQIKRELSDLRINRSFYRAS
ncbi:hypothetical protein [Chroococcidiopsis sp.]|uniref:hypothetical protein n=1 Tax=Chroococcidiopsis sp. TaxID=3088168 RepID=UPI003F3A9BB1